MNHVEGGGTTGGNEESRAKAEAVVDAVKLPSLPEAVAHLLEICRDEYVSSQDIVRVVELDPALTARLLKVANSSYYGQTGKVGTLKRAAVVLGNESVKAAALGFYLGQGWRYLGHQTFDMRGFWRDCILRACLARQLARRIEMHPVEQAFILGMLNDVGTLIMATHFGEEYISALAAFPGDFVGRRALELERFELDHTQVAAEMCRKWRFPETLVTALANQCECPPVERTNDGSCLLWQMAYFCAAVPFAVDRQTAKVADSLRNLALGGFGLSFEALSETFTASVEQFNLLRGVFSDLSPAECNEAELITEAERLMSTFDPEIIDRLEAV